MRSEHVRRILGRKRTVEILAYLSGGTFRNYSELEGTIDTSSDTLTDSLEILSEYSLIDRKEESKRNVKYGITDSGEVFLDSVSEIEDLLEKQVD